MKTQNLKIKMLFLAMLSCGIFGFTKNSWAASWYVDNSVVSSGNGQSWATAWKNLSNVAGLSAGDTVYISGGSTYAVSAWNPASGASGNPITFKIGQEAGHNGTATLNCGGDSLPTSPNIVISGDAGDGNRHFVTSNCPMGIEANSNVRVSYITFGDVDTLIYLGGAYAGIEIDHCTATAYNDRLAYWEITSGSGYAANKVHDNSFALSYHAGAGNVWEGADGFQGNNSYTDFYNNFIYGVADNRGINHGDAFQASGGGGGTRYVRIFNNKIRDLGNYGIYFEAYASPVLMEHIKIYNNVIDYTDINIKNGSTQAIAIGPSEDNFTFSDFIVANNTVADSGPGAGAINFWNPGGRPGTFTNCYVQNNIEINGGGDAYDPAVVHTNNVALTLSASSGHFASYAPLSASNDYHLGSADATFKDKGVSLSSYFTADKDGISRPQGAAWDIGAYEYAPGGIVDTPPAAPTGLIVN